MSLSDVRQGLVQALNQVSGLRPTTKFSAPAPGTALVGLPRHIVYDEDSNDGATYTIPIKVFASNDDSGDAFLTTCMNPSGSGSVKAAIETDPGLGGACSSVRVTEMEMAAPDYEATRATVLTADWLAEVYA